MIKISQTALFPVLFLTGLLAKAEALGPETTSLNQESKIQKLLKDEAKNLSQDFPYRINLFTQGQIAKNNAGTRIAETANQLSAPRSL